MIRGEFLDFTEKQLNTIKIAKETIEQAKKWERSIEIRPYHHVVSIDELMDEYGVLDSSSHFREQCLGEGFKLLNLYPCYHQGWECDEWGAIGERDSKKYVLETSHGSLQTPKELEEGWKPVFKMIKTLFVRGDEGEE
jgi:hypothetical protein